MSGRNREIFVIEKETVSSESSSKKSGIFSLFRRNSDRNRISTGSHAESKMKKGVFQKEISTNLKKAERFARGKKYISALTHYKKVLEIVREAHEENSNRGFEDPFDQKELVADVHTRMAVVYESLGDMNSSMEAYRTALPWYQLCIDNAKRKETIDGSPSAPTDQMDKTMATVMARMANIEMMQDQNVDYALTLYISSLRALRNLRLRQIAQVGDGSLSRSEIEYEMISLLTRIGDLSAVAGDHDGANRAYANAHDLEVRAKQQAKGGGSRKGQRKSLLQLAPKDRRQEGDEESVDSLDMLDDIFRTKGVQLINLGSTVDDETIDNSLVLERKLRAKGIRIDQGDGVDQRDIVEHSDSSHGSDYDASTISYTASVGSYSLLDGMLKSRGISVTNLRSLK